MTFVVINQFRVWLGLSLQDTPAADITVCQVCACYFRNTEGRGYYSKTCVKRPLSIRWKIGFQDQLSLDAGQKYCRMLQGEHYAIISTFIKLLFVIKISVLYILSGCFTQVLL